MVNIYSKWAWKVYCANQCQSRDYNRKESSITVKSMWECIWYRYMHVGTAIIHMSINNHIYVQHTVIHYLLWGWYQFVIFADEPTHLLCSNKVRSMINSLIPFGLDNYRGKGLNYCMTFGGHQYGTTFPKAVESNQKLIILQPWGFVRPFYGVMFVIWTGDIGHNIRCQ